MLIKSFRKSEIVCLFATIILILSSLVTASPTVFATESNSDYQNAQIANSFDQMAELSENSTFIENPSQVNEYISLVDNGLSTGEITALGDLNFDESRLLEIEAEGENYTSLSIPVTGEEYSFLSNLTVVYDNNKEIVTYSETLYTTNEDNKFVVSNYVDGTLVEQKDTDMDYHTDEELREGLENIQNGNVVQPQGVGGVAACIVSVAGVTGVVGYMLVTACTGACITLNPVCAACIGGFAAIGAADIGAVAACFQLL